MDHDTLPTTVEATVRETMTCLLGKPWLNPDGGIGRIPDLPSDLWSTAEALILANRMRNMSPLTASDVDKMKDFILTSQHGDGGWGSDDPESDVVGTPLALMALRRWRDEAQVRAVAAKGVGWLARKQNADGGWDVTPSRPNTGNVSTVYPTIHAYEAIGVWFLDNVGPIAPAQQALSNARVWLTNARAGGGGVRESTRATTPTVRPTAYVVLVDRSAGDLDLPYSAVARWLEQEQHRDGSWGRGGVGSNVESTAAAVRALLQLAIPPNSKRIRAGIEWLLRQRCEQEIAGQHRAGWPTKPGGSPTSWPTYYALMAFADYLDALRRPTSQTTLHFPRWRRIVVSVLLIVLAVAILATVLVAGSDRRFAATLVTLVAVANIIAAFPLVISWIRRLRMR